MFFSVSPWLLISNLKRALNFSLSNNLFSNALISRVFNCEGVLLLSGVWGSEHYTWILNGKKFFEGRLQNCRVRELEKQVRGEEGSADVPGVLKLVATTDATMAPTWSSLRKKKTKNHVTDVPTRISKVLVSSCQSSRQETETAESLRISALFWNHDMNYFWIMNQLSFSMISWTFVKLVQMTWNSNRKSSVPYHTMFEFGSII